MPTVINTNLASLFAQNSLANAQNNLATSVQRLSSGLRINSAKDDAAGLAIAQNMQSQLNGTNQSIQNLSDATNLLQTADSSLSTIQDMLLRLKQLATQGYDGSLSGTQKLDIMQQMSDLNTEINATATRTQFNGINLLTSGSSVDLVNSGIQNGSTLVATPTSVSASSGTGLYATGGASATIGLADGAQTGGTASTYAVVLDSTKANYDPGTYTLSANGNQLTLTGTYQGLSQSQTVTVADVNAIDANAPVASTQSLNFSNFGVRLDVTSTVIAGTNQTGSNIAAKFASATYKTLTVNGSNASVSNISLSGVAPGTYTVTAGAGLTGTSAQTVGTTMTAGTYVVKLTDATIGAVGGQATVVVNNAGTIGSITLSGGAGYAASDVLTIAANALGSNSGAVSFTLGSGNTNVNTVAAGSLNISGTVNGVATSQTVALSALNSQNSESVGFGSFGISFNVTNNGSTSPMTATTIGGLLAGLTNSSQTAAGQLVVSSGNNSLLQFQSGPTSQSFININTLNVQTANTGANAGTSAEMIGVGTAITSTASGYLGGLTSNSTIAQWQAAFQNAAAAIDKAVDYISTQRTTFGSQMNRLSYISTNLTAQSTNLQQSRSSIMDTNFASETATLTKGQIMQQAATAMLAQANQMPNVILSLLK